MTMTPEQLREIADSIASRECVMERGPLAEFFRAHASALERLAELEAARNTAERYVADLIYKVDERDAEIARLKGQLVEQKAIIEALMAGSMVASDEGAIPVIRRIELLREQLALAYDAINDALAWMIKLGDYIGNGTQADPMGRCNAITKMRIAVEMRDDRPTMQI